MCPGKRNSFMLIPPPPPRPPSRSSEHPGHSTEARGTECSVHKHTHSRTHTSNRGNLLTVESLTEYTIESSRKRQRLVFYQGVYLSKDPPDACLPAATNRNNANKFNLKYITGRHGIRPQDNRQIKLALKTGAECLFAHSTCALIGLARK